MMSGFMLMMIIQLPNLFKMVLIKVLFHKIG